MSTETVEEMVDEQQLRHLLDQSEDFDLRRRIRARLRQLKKDAPPAIETEKPKSYDATYMKYQRSTPSERISKPVEPSPSKQNGHREFVDKSSHLRNAKTDYTTTKPSSVSGGMQLEKVVLRNSPRTEVSKQTTSSGAKLEQVALRKVTHDSKASDSSKLRSNAAKMTPKAAFERFKEMDLNSDAGKRYLEAGDGAARRRSPSPNSIREQMLEWCRARVSYYDIEIDDFSTSWNDGMAFCALVHSFYPQAFDYDTLDRKDKAKNFQLAFDSAEKFAGVVPLLDVEDMVRTNSPDWKCVFTYVNSFANRMSEIRRERKNAEMLEREKEQKNSNEKEINSDEKEINSDEKEEEEIDED